MKIHRRLSKHFQNNLVHDDLGLNMKTIWNVVIKKSCRRCAQHSNVSANESAMAQENPNGCRRVYSPVDLQHL